MTTSAGYFAPTMQATERLIALDRCFIAVAIACSSTVLSHVNDSRFWLAGRFLEMDEKMTLKTWAVIATPLGVIGFALALLGSKLL